MVPPQSASPFHYVYIRGQNYGPYTTAQLADMAWKGTIKPETPWCMAGAATWSTVAAAPGVTFQPRTAPPERHSRPCPRCSGWLVSRQVEQQKGAGCIVLLIGLLLAPILIGIPIFFYGLHLMDAGRNIWWCNTCGVQIPD